MKSWIILIYFFSEGLFFGTLALFSVTHAEDSSAYAFYMLILFAIILYAWFISFAKKSISSDKEIPIIKLVIFSIILFLGLNLFFHYISNGSSALLDIIKYFVSLVIPAVLITLSSKESDILGIYGKIKYLNIYLTFCFVIAFINNDGVNGFTGIAGATHLTIGYTMSFLFAYNYFKLITEKTVTKKAFHFCLMIINVSLILFSGSRGALVGVIINFLVITYMYVIKRKKTLRFFGIASILIMVSVPLFKRLNFEETFRRIALTFSGDIEVSTSGRNFIYEDVIRMIKENPIFGNGIGSYAVESGRYIFPHQLFLEVLNDFGILGLGVLLILLLILLRKIIIVLKQPNESKHIIVFFFITVFSMLMVSGSYLVNLQFWIVLTLILFMKKKSSEKCKNSNSQLEPTTT